jgi:biotin operon repressor
LLYERSLAIEKRLQDVLELVRAGCYCTPAIAERLGVSVPTISRDVTALRERGYDIRAERNGDAWRYILVNPDAAQSNGHARTRKAVTA